MAFDSVWGGEYTPHPKETLLEIRGGNVFTAYGHQIT